MRPVESGALHCYKPKALQLDLQQISQEAVATSETLHSKVAVRIERNKWQPKNLRSLRQSRPWHHQPVESKRAKR
jgi:hypothetical protein